MAFPLSCAVSKIEVPVRYRIGAIIGYPRTFLNARHAPGVVLQPLDVQMPAMLGTVLEAHVDVDNTQVTRKLTRTRYPIRGRIRRKRLYER